MAGAFPAWWGWDLELSPHLLRRMVDRGFTEVEVRAMLAAPRRIARDEVPGRWRIDGSLRVRPRRVVVEPDPFSQVLVVVTTFPIGRNQP